MNNLKQRSQSGTEDSHDQMLLSAKAFYYGKCVEPFDLEAYHIWKLATAEPNQAVAVAKEVQGVSVAGAPDAQGEPHDAY